MAIGAQPGNIAAVEVNTDIFVSLLEDWPPAIVRLRISDKVIRFLTGTRKIESDLR